MWPWKCTLWLWPKSVFHHFEIQNFSAIRLKGACLMLNKKTFSTKHIKWFIAVSFVKFFVVHNFNFVHFSFEKTNLFFLFSRRFCVGSLTEKRRRRLVSSVLSFCNHVTVCLLQVSLQDEVVSVILYYFGGGRFEDWECYFWRLQDISTPYFLTPRFNPRLFVPIFFNCDFFQPQKSWLKS